MKMSSIPTATLIALTFLFAVPVLAGDPVGDPGNTGRKVEIQPPPFEIGGPPPIPVPEPPLMSAIDVNVLNFPVDDSGHLVICDHSESPRRVEVTNPDRRFELVGFTSVTTLPDIGVFGLTRACGREFSGTRMCTLAEALGTIDVPGLHVGPPHRAWVRDGEATALAGRLVVPSRASCSGWGATDGVGLVVTTEGSIAVQPCNEAAHVACCAAVQ